MKGQSGAYEKMLLDTRQVANVWYQRAINSVWGLRRGENRAKIWEASEIMQDIFLDKLEAYARSIGLTSL